MEKISTIELLYQALGINRKIQEQELRIIYLKDVWGLPQSIIGKCEEISQSLVSNLYKKALRKYSGQDIRNLASVSFDGKELEYLQKLPREVLTDAQLMAFTKDILRIYTRSPIFNTALSKGTRVAALASLGVQVKHLVKVFNANQPTISMMVKRKKEVVYKYETIMRFDFDMDMQVETLGTNEGQKYKFIIAGGN